MGIAERLLTKLNTYDQIAAIENWAETWTDDMSCLIQDYLNWCIENDRQPSFGGLETFLDQKHGQQFMD